MHFCLHVSQENDILEISSSEHQTWAHKKSPNQSYIKVYLKPWSKNQKIQNSSFIFEGFKPKHIPKLLLPKFSRPAMYSLNGYIPKPNMQSFTTTTTTKKPTIVKYKKFGIETRTVKKTENQEKILIQKKVNFDKFVFKFWKKEKIKKKKERKKERCNKFIKNQKVN